MPTLKAPGILPVRPRPRMPPKPVASQRPLYHPSSSFSLPPNGTCQIRCRQKLATRVSYRPPGIMNSAPVIEPAIGIGHTKKGGARGGGAVTVLNHYTSMYVLGPTYSRFRTRARHTTRRGAIAPTQHRVHISAIYFSTEMWNTAAGGPSLGSKWVRRQVHEDDRTRR